MVSKKGKGKPKKKEKKPGKQGKKSGKAQKTSLEKVSTAFFIMPAEALLTLREELSPLASELAIRAILFRYGFRSGEACMQRIGINVKEGKLLEILPDLWDEIGLGRLSLTKSSKKGFALHLNESIEANAIGEVGQASCDFTRGYLAGIVSSLSGKRYHCKEEICISRGDTHCSFHLGIRVERV